MSINTIAQKVAALQEDCDARGDYTAVAENVYAHTAQKHGVEPSARLSELVEADVYCCHTCSAAIIHVAPEASDVHASRPTTSAQRAEAEAALDARVRSMSVKPERFEYVYSEEDVVVAPSLTELDVRAPDSDVLVERSVRSVQVAASFTDADDKAERDERDEQERAELAYQERRRELLERELKSAREDHAKTHEAQVHLMRNAISDVLMSNPTTGAMIVRDFAALSIELAEAVVAELVRQRT